MTVDASSDVEDAALADASDDSMVLDADSRQEDGTAETSDDAPWQDTRGPDADAVAEDVAPADAEELCNGIRCVLPPPDECPDLVVRRIYDSPGGCLDGRCVFPHRDLSCDDVCVWGECKSVYCSGKVCMPPPSDVCSDERTLVTHPPVGVCEADKCLFQAMSVVCSQGCKDGQCTTGSWSVEEITSDPTGSGTLDEASLAVDAVGNPNFEIVVCVEQSWASQLEVYLSPTGWDLVEMSFAAACGKGQLAIDRGDIRHFLLTGNGQGVFNYASGYAEFPNYVWLEHVNPGLRDSVIVALGGTRLAVDEEGSAIVLAWEQEGTAESGDHRLVTIRKPIDGGFAPDRVASFPFLDGAHLNAVMALDHTRMPEIAVSRHTGTGPQTTLVENLFGVPVAGGWSLESVPAVGMVSAIAMDGAGSTYVLLVDGNLFRLAHRSEFGQWDTEDGATDVASPEVGLVVESAGTVGVGYWAKDRGLIYTTWANGTWSDEVVDAEPSPGSSLSVVVDKAGRVHWGYLVPSPAGRFLRHARRE